MIHSINLTKKVHRQKSRKTKYAAGLQLHCATDLGGKNLEAGVQITADLVWSPGAGEEAGGIPEHVRDARDIRQGDLGFLLGPSELAWEALVFCLIETIPVRSGLQRRQQGGWAWERTEEVSDELLLDCGILQSPKDDEGGGDLAEAELLGGRRERVIGVVGPRGDLPRQLAVGDLLGREDVGGPVDGGGVEDGLVEDVVVAEEGIGAAGDWVVSRFSFTIGHSASTYLKLASCSKTLWRLRLSLWKVRVIIQIKTVEVAHSVKKVALGSGLAMTAWSHMIPASSALKLIPVPKAWIAFSRVMFRPSRGRKPWFARVFIIGQGPRTTRC